MRLRNGEGQKSRYRKNATISDSKSAMAWHFWLAIAPALAQKSQGLSDMRVAFDAAFKKNKYLPGAVKQCIFIALIKNFQ